MPDVSQQPITLSHSPQLNPAVADQILWEFPDPRRALVVLSSWLPLRNHEFAAGAIGSGVVGSFQHTIDQLVVLRPMDRVVTI